MNTWLHICSSLRPYTHYTYIKIWGQIDTWLCNLGSYLCVLAATLHLVQYSVCITWGCTLVHLSLSFRCFIWFAAGFLIFFMQLDSTRRPWSQVDCMLLCWFVAGAGVGHPWSWSPLILGMPSIGYSYVYLQKGSTTASNAIYHCILFFWHYSHILGNTSVSWIYKHYVHII